MGVEDRNLAIERLRARAELRSADLEEDTGQIEVTALSRAPKSSSTPAPARGIVAVLNTLPAWSRPIVLVIFGLLLGGGGLWALLARAGWVK